TSGAGGVGCPLNRFWTVRLLLTLVNGYTDAVSGARYLNSGRSHVNSQASRRNDQVNSCRWKLSRKIFVVWKRIMFHYADPVGRNFLSIPSVEQEFRQHLQGIYGGFASRRNCAFTCIESFQQVFIVPLDLVVT